MGPGSLQNMTLCHISLISIFFCISSPPCICACVCARCELLLCVWFTSISSDYLHTAYTCTSNISIYSFSLTEEIKSFYIAQLKLKLTKKKYPSQATLMQCHFAYWTNLIFNTDAQNSTDRLPHPVIQCFYASNRRKRCDAQWFTPWCVMRVLRA